MDWVLYTYSVMLAVVASTRFRPRDNWTSAHARKIIVCEYCGRIMIDPELAGITPEQKVEVVKEKPVRAKRKNRTYRLR